jgi:hypothetical protein
MHERDALLQLGLLVLLCGLERPFEVVQDRQQLLDEPLRRVLGPFVLQASLALAVVVELGLQPLQPVQVVVALLGHRSELVDFLDLLLRALLGHHLPSSTTS